ncbi:hypothetical protein, partial [Granulicatella sp. zg-ZJ]|uniref:hypothetical protein n=1 Tax=Granulicatella sp. zg-ZJ TaxID=2678504 RepID=UPI0019677B57
YFNHTTPFSVAEKECEKGSEWLMPFTTNILTISLHQHNLTKSPFLLFSLNYRTVIPGLLKTHEALDK